MNVFWFPQKEAHGGTRHRLFINHKETPYFVDQAPNSAHYTLGKKYGLYGSGMGQMIECETPYRIAACFGGFDTLKEAKERAVKLATTKAEKVS